MNIRRVFILIIILAGIQITACKHKDEATTAIIDVVDVVGNPVENVNVKFYLDTAKVKGKTIEGLPETLITNSSGKVEKRFNNGVVVDILAGKRINGDSVYAKTYILLEPGETQEKKVVIKKPI